MSDPDTLIRFVVDPGHVRGEHIRLGTAWRTVLGRLAYPEAVRDLLGEAVAATNLLVATLKFEGRLTLQVRGAGPVSLLVVQARADRRFRAMARWQGEDVARGTLGELLGEGQLVITLEPARGERYQGIVPLSGATLAEALEEYFTRSEQLPTRLWLAADGEHCAGLLLQKMPGEGEEAEEDWSRVGHLGATVRHEELLSLPGETLLYRLYHEERVRVLEESDVHFHCGCSRQRVGEMLLSLGREEAESVLEEQGSIEVDCEFCNAHYRFDAVDVAQLFVAEDATSTAHPTRH
ncbi:MAG: Hsp33 family molecular chaperone HslO [Halothiobacillaceae bacterium]|jgi:molecular chaperone Hsp33|nr:Hsp33 family molecular chaperone HslO [Halothiobacillaceae bacterium]